MVILVSLPIAGCTLAVSVAAGLTDRKRPFSLLRLTGAPLGVLRRVVALESAAPLLITALVSTGLGFLAAGLFVSAQLGYPLRPPGAEYYLIVLAGLAASLGIIASTLPCWTGSPARKPPATSNRGEAPAGQAAASADKISRSRIRTSVST